MWLSWKHQDSDIAWPPKLEQKIDLFYERALGWQLHIADLIANGGSALDGGQGTKALRHSGFAVLQICLSYFETIGKYEQSSRKTKTSKGYFKEGALSVLPTLGRNAGATNKLLERLYDGARCGLYHSSMTKPGVGLGQPGNGEPIAYDDVSETLAISPERLPKALKAHLERYRRSLLDPKNKSLRSKFERQFDRDNGIK
jgi:hypothetical protein